jgi:hypothetical protein
MHVYIYIYIYIPMHCRVVEYGRMPDQPRCSSRLCGEFVDDPGTNPRWIAAGTGSARRSQGAAAWSLCDRRFEPHLHSSSALQQGWCDGAVWGGAAAIVSVVLGACAAFVRAARAVVSLPASRIPASRSPEFPHRESCTPLFDRVPSPAALPLPRCHSLSIIKQGPTSISVPPSLRPRFPPSFSPRLPRLPPSHPFPGPGRSLRPGCACMDVQGPRQGPPSRELRID